MGNRDPHPATVATRGLSVATARHAPAAKGRRLASRITTEYVSIVGRTGAPVAYPFGRIILEWCPAQNRAAVRIPFLLSLHGSVAMASRKLNSTPPAERIGHWSKHRRRWSRDNANDPRDRCREVP